jgi:hypothetical protein
MRRKLIPDRLKHAIVVVSLGVLISSWLYTMANRFPPDVTADVFVNNMVGYCATVTLDADHIWHHQHPRVPGPVPLRRLNLPAECKHTETGLTSVGSHGAPGAAKELGSAN